MADRPPSPPHPSAIVNASIPPDTPGHDSRILYDTFLPVPAPDDGNPVASRRPQRVTRRDDERWRRRGRRRRRQRRCSADATDNDAGKRARRNGGDGGGGGGGSGVTFVGWRVAAAAAAVIAHCGARPQTSGRHAVSVGRRKYARDTHTHKHTRFYRVRHRH